MLAALASVAFGFCIDKRTPVLVLVDVQALKSSFSDIYDFFGQTFLSAIKISNLHIFIENFMRVGQKLHFGSAVVVVVFAVVKSILIHDCFVLSVAIAADHGQSSRSIAQHLLRSLLGFHFFAMFDF